MMLRSLMRGRVVRISGERAFSTSMNTAPPAKIEDTPPDTPLPTRHSRHATPPACLSFAELKDETQEVMEAKPGSLISYETSERDDSFHAWEVADLTVQKVEWLIRGYSAQVKDTQMQLSYGVQPTEDPAECIQAIEGLMEKMDAEGNFYMELRNQMRSRIMVEEQNEASEPGIDTKSDEAKTVSKTPSLTFAPPGQTINMYDTMLDSMSMAPTGDTPEFVGKTLKNMYDRFARDGGIEFNVNPNTVPTHMTINAGLRAIANTEDPSEKTRDDAIMYSFGTFDAMRDTNVKRNAATFAYMILIVAKFMPPSEMSANISHGLWRLAKEEQVIDTNIMKAMERISCDYSEQFKKFMDETIQNKTIMEIPRSWKKFGKSRRHTVGDDTY